MADDTDWSRPAPAAELDRLAPLIGDWTSEDTHHPMPWAPRPARGTSRHSFKRALDGYCFLSDYAGEMPFGHLEGHGIWFFDSEHDLYRIAWYDSFANFLEGAGIFEADDRLVFRYEYRMAGQTVRERHTFLLAPPDRYRHEIETLLDGAFRPTSELDYRRMG